MSQQMASTLKLLRYFNPKSENFMVMAFILNPPLTSTRFLVQNKTKTTIINQNKAKIGERISSSAGFVPLETLPEG